MKISKGELILGDCLEKMKDITDKSIDLILTDLPYGTIDCKWDAVIPMEKLWEHYKRILTDIGTVVLTANQPFTSLVVASNYRDFKYAWVWEKNRPTLPQHSKNRPMGKHEDIVVFSKGKMGHKSQVKQKRMIYNPQGVTDSKIKIIDKNTVMKNTTGLRPNQLGRVYQSQTGFPHTILKFDKEEKHLHPTQKPVLLFEYLIKTYTDENMTVLDNCSGSGTTAIACENLNRQWICIEQDQTYYDKSMQRIKDHCKA